MMQLLTLALLTLASLAAALPAAAQTQSVWRCGPDGRVFQGTPCADGRSLALKPTPDAAMVAEAQAVVAREQQALRTLAGQRRERERNAVAGASGIAVPAQPAPKRIRPSPAAPEGCGTSPAAGRASPRDQAARGCS